MKIIKIILIFYISFVHTSCGQIGVDGSEKLITTIEYYGNNPDTNIQKIKYDNKGNRIEELSTLITISTPITIDTIRISNEERLVEYSWADNSKSVTKEMSTSTELTRIGIDKNGIDTIHFSSYKLGKEGLLKNGVRINYSDTTNYILNENVTMKDLFQIESNIIEYSEFISLKGIIEFQENRQILITDSNEPRNTTSIELNNNLKPIKVVKNEWHEYHKMVFKNIYSYEYEKNELVMLRNIDNEGDVEMERFIEYKTH